MTDFSAKDSTGTAQVLKLADITAAGSPSTTNLMTVQGTSTGTPIPVTMASSTLPTGAATAAAQATQQANLTSIDSKISTTTVSGNPAINVAIVAGGSGGGSGGDASAANQVTGNSSLATIVTNTAGLATATAQTAGNSSLATLAATVPVAVESQVNFTRPADTTAYSANDAVSDSTSSSTLRTFSNLARVSGGSGYITKARLMTSQSTNTARFRLHLYNVAPTAIADNAQQTILYANRANYVGTLDFSGLATEGTGSDTAFSINNSPRLPFTTNGSSSLFGMLEALDPFTPASAQTFFVALTAEQN